MSLQTPYCVSLRGRCKAFSVTLSGVLALLYPSISPQPVMVDTIEGLLVVDEAHVQVYQVVPGFLHHPSQVVYVVCRLARTPIPSSLSAITSSSICSYNLHKPVMTFTASSRPAVRSSIGFPSHPADFRCV